MSQTDELVNLLSGPNRKNQLTSSSLAPWLFNVVKNSYIRPFVWLLCVSIMEKWEKEWRNHSMQNKWREKQRVQCRRHIHSVCAVTCIIKHRGKGAKVIPSPVNLQRTGGGKLRSWGFWQRKNRDAVWQGQIHLDLQWKSTLSQPMRRHEHTAVLWVFSDCFVKNSPASPLRWISPEVFSALFSAIPRSHAEDCIIPDICTYANNQTNTCICIFTQQDLMVMKITTHTNRIVGEFH